MSVTWRRWIVYALVALFAGLFIASLHDRKMHGDDAWLGEQAYWMSKLGYVRSNLFRGMLDYDERQTVYHKLFIWTGAAAVKTLGWSLYNLKAVSLLFYCIFVVASYAHFRRKSSRFSPGSFWLFTALMLSAPLVFRYAFIYRPEVMLMTLGFLSFHFLDVGRSAESAGQGLEPGGREAGGRALLAGVFAGLGLVTHLNGWIFIAAGLAILLSRRAGRPALAFVAGAAAASALYFLDLASMERLRLFAYQMRNDLPIGQAGAWTRLLYLAYEPRRFFYSIREIFPSALLVLSLAFAWKALVAKHREVLIYLAVLVVGLALLSRPRPSYYIVIYMPYIAMVITAALTHAGSLARFKRYALTAFVVANFAVSFFLSVSLIRAAGPLAAQNARIASVIPRGVPVAAPAGFIFNEIASYEIQGLTFYDRYAERRGTRLGAADFFALASSFGNAYVILDAEFAGKIGLRTLPEGTVQGQYMLLRTVEDRQIFKAVDGPTSPETASREKPGEPT